jgi:PIN domain nuclease of toxin-antitoxin system
MDYLLDTHTFMWFINGSEELSLVSRKAIEDKNSNSFISIASIWEMAIKLSIGKLKVQAPFSSLPAQIVANGFQILPVKFEDTLELSSMPFHHRDPFDRLIIAQSITNKLLLISKDKQFLNYGIDVIW